MIETRAIIIRLEGNEALVESTQGGGCGNCDSENGCGSGKLSQLFCTEPRRFRVLNESNAQVGTLVQVSLAEGVLLRSALLMYMLPLASLVSGAAIGGLWMDGESSEIFSAAGGFAGLSLGFVMAKALSSRRKLSSVAKPVILSADI
jgi:sigma-E factor negative regulatory protein RseC